MGELESLSDRILRLSMERDVDPIAQLLLEVKAEARSTRELLEATRKGGGGNGIGNGRFALVRDIVVVILIPLAFMLGAFVVSIGDRVARLETKAVTMEQLNALEVRARTERTEAINIIRQELQRHEDAGR